MFCVLSCFVFSNWIGSLPVHGAGEPLVQPALRPPVSPFGNVEEFPPVEARYVRFVILETNGGEPGLDELEVFSAEPDPRNVALRDAGAKVVASSSETIGTMHRLRNLNDGRYGNESSWLVSGGLGARGVAQQTVDVRPSAASIDREEITATLSALIGGWGDQEDAMVVQAVFQNEWNEPIGEPARIGPVTARDRGNRTTVLPRSATKKVPPVTRWIEVTMTARRQSGEFNDGYADNVSLILHRTTGEPGAGLNTNLLANGGAEEDGAVTTDNSAPPAGWLRTEGTLTVWPYAATNYGGQFSPGPSQGRNFFLGGKVTSSNVWWAQIELPQAARINRIVWSRDRTGSEITRTPIRYRIEVATEPDRWQVVASSDDRQPYPDLIELRIPASDSPPLSFDVENWGEANGLPSNAVNDLAQTPDGYLWASTDRGLARFDGNHFKVFDVRNRPELGTSAFGDLYCDPAGRLWIQLHLPPGATNNLALYEKGRFTRINTEGQNASWVRADAEGTPWISCNHGLFPWRNGKLDTNAPALSSEDSTDIGAWVGADKELWLRSGDRLGKIIGGYWHAVTNRSGQSLQLEGATTIRGAIHPKGSRWIAIGGLSAHASASFGPNGLREILPGGQLSELNPFPWAVRNFETRGLWEDHVGDLWIAAGIPDYALYRMSPNGSRYERFTERQGLSDTEISNVLPDREGNIWVGTRRGGINLMRRHSFHTLAALPARKIHGVASVSPARDGGVWLCANDSGIYRWNDGRLFRLFSDHMPFGTVIEDQVGGVWAGGEALSGQRHFVGRWTVAAPPAVNQPNHASAIMEDRAGRIWLGGNHGLSCYDHGKAMVYKLPPLESQLPDSVIALAEGLEGSIWLGTKSGHLHHFREGQFETLWKPSGKPVAPVCSIYFDKSGALWFARYGIGLSRLKDDQLTHYGTADGLPTSSFNGMVEDQKEFVWLTSKAGVYRISQPDLQSLALGDTTHIRWRHFTKKDGLPSLDCYGEQNQPSLCLTADGRIWIPTLQGVAVVDPNSVLASSPPSVVIEELRLYGQGNRVETLLDDGDYLQHSGPDPLEITVPPGQNNLVLRYTGIDFRDPSLVTFRYRIPGLDPAWVEAKDARTAIYSSLKPGTYRFELVALNKDGVASPTALLGLRVLPFWWQTWTFRVLMGALFLLSGPIFYVRRVNLLKRRAATQAAFSRQLIEREEAERKHIAQEIHDVLGHDLLLLKNSAVQGAQAAATPPEAREQFERISGLASQTIEEARGISHHLRPPELDRLGFNDAIQSLLAKVSGTTDLRVFKELDALDDVLPPETQVYLYRIVQEGLNNVLKHARASTVMLEIKRDGDLVQIKLEDDGAGFDLAAVEQRRAGLGLTGMEERAKLVGGQFEIFSSPGAGTRIRIIVPLPPAER